MKHRIVGLSLVVLGLSCKRMPQSDLQTLQDFSANGSVAGNICQGSNTTESRFAAHTFINNKMCSTMNPADPDAGKCEVVKRTLTAVPSAVQTAYFDLGGNIAVHSSANMLCSELLSNPKSPQYLPDASRRKISGCLMFVQGGDFKGLAAGQSRLMMFLDNNDLAIQHNLVREFGFLYSQMIPRMTMDTASKKYNLDIASPEDVKFTGLKVEVASKYLADMVRLEANPASKYKLDYIKNHLGVDGPARVRANHAAGSADLLGGLSFALDGETNLDPAQSAVRRERFLSTVFAEAFDSMNCTIELRQDTLQNFALAGQYFTAIESAIVQRATTMSVELSTGRAALVEETPSEGFALNDMSAFTGSGLGALLSQLFGGGFLNKLGQGANRAGQVVGSAAGGNDDQALTAISADNTRTGSDSIDGLNNFDSVCQGCCNCPGCKGGNCTCSNCPGGCCCGGQCGLS